MLISMDPINCQGPHPEISHSGLRSFLILYYYVFSLITYIYIIFLNWGYKLHACLWWETLIQISHCTLRRMYNNDIGMNIAG
jgi:hypothetical protein